MSRYSTKNYNFYKKTEEIIKKLENDKFSINDIYNLVENQKKIINSSEKYHLLLENLEKIKNTNEKLKIKSLLEENLKYINNIKENKKAESCMFGFLEFIASPKPMNLIGLISFISSLIAGIIIYNYLSSIRAIEVLKDSVISSNFIIISAFVILEIFSQVIIFSLFSFLLYFWIGKIIHINNKKFQILKSNNDRIILSRIIIIFLISAIITFILTKKAEFDYIYFENEIVISKIVAITFFINMYLDLKFIKKETGQGYRLEKITTFFLIIFIFLATIGNIFLRDESISKKMEKLGFRDQDYKIYIISQDLLPSLPNQIININRLKLEEIPHQIANGSCGKLVWNANEVYVFQPKGSEKTYRIPKDKITLLQRDDIYEQCE